MKKRKSKDSRPQVSSAPRDLAFSGNAIRRIRQRQGQSVRGLAGRSGISPSYLSAIERGLEAPSLAAMRALAAALGVPLFALLSGDGSGTTISRAAERPRMRFPDSATQYEVVSLDPRRDVQLYIGHLAAGAANTASPVGHGTTSEECLYVLSGKVVVVLGNERWRLGKSDSIHFDGVIPHQIVADPSGPASFLSITCGTFPTWSEQQFPPGHYAGFIPR
ncbi:MAG: helix-turn-helix domain-containing protein [Burkholderiales bacterium]|nr:helix-turn-helix domain-containing protein [Burkholderiales bacterium]